MEHDDLVAMAQKMMQAARAGLAIERARLKKILEERQKAKEAGEPPASTQAKSD